MTRLKIAPLHPSLGAEVAGVDLSHSIDAQTREARCHRRWPSIWRSCSAIRR